MVMGSLHLTETDRGVLTAWTRAGKTPQRVVRRAGIVLLAAEGSSTRDIAARLGVSTRTVALWQRRFKGGGPAALLRDAPGRGRKASVTAAANGRLRTLLAMPPPAGRWTVRALAAAAGISAASVHRVLKPIR
jgi:transposase